MGYDFHITRKRSEAEVDTREITFEEWKAYVSGGPEMTITGVFEVTSPKGAVIRVPGEGITKWTGHSRIPELWMEWRRGEISLRGTDDPEFLKKIFAIAAAFDAGVRGDEGEFYEPDGSVASPAPRKLPVREERKPWWRFW